MTLVKFGFSRQNQSTFLEKNYFSLWINLKNVLKLYYIDEKMWFNFKSACTYWEKSIKSDTKTQIFAALRGKNQIRIKPNYFKKLRFPSLFLLTEVKAFLLTEEKCKSKMAMEYSTGYSYVLTSHSNGSLIEW